MGSQTLMTLETLFLGKLRIFFAFGAVSDSEDEDSELEVRIAEDVEEWGFWWKVLNFKLCSNFGFFSRGFFFFFFTGSKRVSRTSRRVAYKNYWLNDFNLIELKRIIKTIITTIIIIIVIIITTTIKIIKNILFQKRKL